MVHNKMKKIAISLLTLVLALGVGQVNVKAANSITGHDFLTENANYRLYVNEEDLSVVIENKKTGAYIQSDIAYDDGKNNESWIGAMKSAVVITMINGNDDTKQADLINDKVIKKVNHTANGFYAELYWQTYKFGFTLNVELTEDGLKASIPDESIHEDGKKYFIGTISIYPYMGNSYLDEKEGYILVPDGNGALIYLNDKEGRFKSGFSGMIYGSDAGFDESDTTTLLKNKYNTISDSEMVIAPVFGIAHTDDKIAYLAVVEDGAARANIECIPNGVSVDYNRAYAKFTLRKTYTQPTSNNSTAGSLHIYEDERSHSNLCVNYMLLVEDEANYAGMASAYREYLLGSGMLKASEDSYKNRIDFMGTERENWVLGTKPVVMTTTDDILEIYEDLNSLGVNDILSVYKGWQKDGLNNLPIDSYKADSKIGGTNELTRLMKSAGEKGIDFYLYNDALRINPDENNATFNVVKKINKRRFEEKTYQDVYSNMLYLIPSRSDFLLDKFVKSYTKSGVNNLALAGISNTLFSYNYSGESHTRFETKESYEKTADKLSQQTKLLMEQPFAYLWKDSLAFLDMPLYTSSFIFEDESVPFLSMVLKGVMPVYSEYVNFEANKKEFFLKMVETGMYPSFYITKASSSDLIYTNSSDIYSSEYSSYRDTIKEYNEALKDLNSKVAGATIKAHSILENGVTVTGYDNGVKVYVNYKNEAVNVDGISVGPMSYEVVKN